MSHTCHAPGCKRLVAPRMYACKIHWFALPQKIRDAIWREYRPGQENDKKPSFRYMAVQQLACAHLVFKPHDGEAVLEAWPYIVEAVKYRQEALAAGLGDPLEGLGAGGALFEHVEERIKMAEIESLRARSSG